MLLSKEVNWELYKGNINNKKQKEGFVKFINNVNEIGANLLTPYEGYEKKVWISIDDAKFYITPHKFNDRTYHTSNKFRKCLLENDDEFICYTNYIKNTGLVAKIKTFDGIETNICIGSYDDFCKSRLDTISMAKELGLKVRGYILNSENATFYNDNCSFEMKPNHFKTQTYKNTLNFIKELKCGDRFVNIVGFVDKKCLVVKIKNKFDTCQDIVTSSYKLFNDTREKFYKYCEDYNYQVLTPYLGSREDILMNIGCEHGEFLTTPNMFLKSKFKCPKCVTFKGENNPMWNPNITEEERENGRFIKGYNDFIKGVYERDNYTCQCCGAVGTGRNLNAHHLDGYNWCKDKRTDINNGITLCTNCHKAFHREYGKGHNTREQYEEWIKQINSDEYGEAS